jgi:methionyl-tRNA formyltransferase
MLLSESTSILADDTAGALHDRLAAMGARLIVRALEELAQGQLASRPQPSTGITYAAKLTRDDERLDWRRPAIELGRQVRALNPRPGAWFAHGDERLKVLSAEILATPHSAAPGLILDDRLTVACGEGALRVTVVHRAGRAPAATADFLRGYALPQGTKLPV